MSQWPKLTSPGVSVEYSQYMPLTVSGPSLCFISPQYSAGNSGMEPKGTGETKIIQKRLTTPYLKTLSEK